MTIEDLGNLGELIAAVATVVTLAYLAVQVRQNTRALRSSTFQGISEQMAQNVQPMVTQHDVAEIVRKGLSGPDELDATERLRFQSLMITTFRRMESVHLQTELGSLDPSLVSGFERSMLSILHSPGGSRWWATAKVTFNDGFVAYVDEWLKTHAPTAEHPSVGAPLQTTRPPGA